MNTATFKRGVHVPESKELTESKPIKTLNPKGDLVFPMQQHIGAPAKPIVAKGDKVLVGQKIAEAGGFVSSPIFSSVSGTVKDIKPMLHPSGNKVNSIIIENDNNYEEHESLNKPKPLEQYTRDEIINAVKEAGIVGLGGAGFPTHVKLSSKADIDTIIVNGAECEPYLTSDHAILLEETEKVVLGLQVVLKLFPKAKGIIAIEVNKMNAIEKVQKQVEGISNISVLPLMCKYPQGSEKQIIDACTGRQVPVGGLPEKAGCIVDNVDTIVAIHRAIYRGRPLMRRIVTVTGNAIKEPCNFKVRIGTNYNELIEAAGGFKEEPGKIISGGPMMGMSLFSTDIPIIKTSSSILCLTKEEAKTYEEQNCIRCGKCVSACPIGLMPVNLNHYVLNSQWEEFEKDNGMSCLSCGACSFVCPANRHLAQSFKLGKDTVAAIKRAEQAKKEGK